MDGNDTGVVELPVEWIRDDAVYFNMNRFAALRPYTPPADVFDIFKREFDAAYRERGIFQLTMHPHVIGYRSRIWILEELIRYMRGHHAAARRHDALADDLRVREVVVQPCNRITDLSPNSPWRSARPRRASRTRPPRGRGCSG